MNDQIRNTVFDAVTALVQSGANAEYILDSLFQRLNRSVDKATVLRTVNQNGWACERATAD